MSHDDLRRHAALVRIYRVLGRHAAVAWIGKDPEQVAKIPRCNR